MWSTIAKKILVTDHCEKIWFYSHDVINRPYIRTYITYSRTAAPSCKSNVKRRTVTSFPYHTIYHTIQIQIQKKKLTHIFIFIGYINDREQKLNNDELRF